MTCERTKGATAHATDGTLVSLQGPGGYAGESDAACMMHAAENTVERGACQIDRGGYSEEKNPL